MISLFEQAIRKAFPDDQTLPVLVVAGRQTDYQCNSAMPIAQVRKDYYKTREISFEFQKLTAVGKKMVATEVAEKIVQNLPQHEIFDKVCLLF